MLSDSEPRPNVTAAGPEKAGAQAPRRACIRVPASTANLGSAFDAVGLALQLYLRVTVEALASGPSRLEFRGRDAALVPEDATNLIWRTMAELAESRGCALPPFLLQIENEIPIERGLGSSASAALAAVAATDFLCHLRLDRPQILALATAVDGHPDNVAPALYGGLVASISGTPVLTARVPFPAGWTVVAVTPDFVLSTRQARAVLPQTVPYRDAVFNVQRAAFLMAQLGQGSREGVREAMRDRLHQPYRSPLVPGLEEILALDGVDGLIGVALSGAGPTVMAFADAHAAEIGERMRGLLAARGVAAEVRLLDCDASGLVYEPEEVRA
jgi:homoserine kinase